MVCCCVFSCSGYFDQAMRQNLFSSWASHLQSASVQFRLDIARTEVNDGLCLGAWGLCVFSWMSGLSVVGLLEVLSGFRSGLWRVLFSKFVVICNTGNFQLSAFWWIKRVEVPCSFISLVVKMYSKLTLSHCTATPCLHSVGSLMWAICRCWYDAGVMLLTEIVLLTMSSVHSSLCAVPINTRRSFSVAVKRSTLRWPVYRECYHLAALQPLPSDHWSQRTGHRVHLEPVQGSQDLPNQVVVGLVTLLRL